MENVKLEDRPVSQISQNIFDNTEKKLGFVPNMYKKMGDNPALLDGYTYAYNSFRTNSGFTPAEQEVIFLSVAFENNCDYCMAAHSFVGDNMTHVPTEVTNAIREDKQVPDLKFGALSKLTRLLTVNRGIATEDEINDFLAAGYKPEHVLGIVAAIGIKTMSNYSNHITNPEVDSAFESRKWTKR